MRTPLKKIEKEIRKEKKDIERIERNVGKIKKELVEKDQPHFSKRDIINAFFGALLIGLTFVFKGRLVETVLALSVSYIILIIISTLFILSVQIYFIGYSRVKDKKHRHFGSFWVKRLLTLYIIALIVSFYLVYTFNVENALGSFVTAFKLVIVISMPCAIGAAIPSLIKQY